MEDYIKNILLLFGQLKTVISSSWISAQLQQ